MGNLNCFNRPHGLHIYSKVICEIKKESIELAESAANRLAEILIEGNNLSHHFISSPSPDEIEVIWKTRLLLDMLCFCNDINRELILERLPSTGSLSTRIESAQKYSLVCADCICFARMHQSQQRVIIKFIFSPDENAMQYMDTEHAVALNLFPFSNLAEHSTTDLMNQSISNLVLYLVYIYSQKHGCVFDLSNFYLTAHSFSHEAHSSLIALEAYSYLPHVKYQFDTTIKSLPNNFIAPQTQAPNILLKDKNALSVRAGNVELWALRGWLRNKSAAESAAKESVRRCLSDANIIVTIADEPWVPRENDINNIIRLSTNAGFYAGVENASDCFSDWANRYANAITKGRIIHHDGHARLLTEALARLRSTRVVEHASIPTPIDFYKRLHNRRILVLSSFSDTMRIQYESGNIFSLWKDVSGVRFELEVINSFITTHPNRPHTGWSETFGVMTDMIKKKLSEYTPDIFIASAGCYGLPLCEWVSSNYDIESVGIGHYANFLFGVLTNDSADVLKAYRNESSWRWGRLDYALNVDFIDGGRYASPCESSI